MNIVWDTFKQEVIIIHSKDCGSFTLTIRTIDFSIKTLSGETLPSNTQCRPDSATKLNLAFACMKSDSVQFKMIRDAFNPQHAYTYCREDPPYLLDSTAQRERGLIAEARYFLATTPRLQDVRNISGPSRHVQSRIRNVREEDKTFHDDEQSTERVPQ